MKVEALVIGSGMTGAVVARYIAEKLEKRVLMLERREHIGGNMYDFVNDEGILVHKYGPHIFHTTKKYLFEYVKQYARWEDYKLTCGAVIDERYTPTPFNFQTVDDFFEKDKAENIKTVIKREYPEEETVPVTDLLKHPNPLLREYAEFLFEKDYRPYTAKQWGISPEEIDPEVLKRVPVRLSYDIGYFEDPYQAMPVPSYTAFFENLLDHTNITLELGTDSEQYLSLDEETNRLIYCGNVFEGICVYTGAIDELFGCRYGTLPYRSLRFEWKSEGKKSIQNAPVVAYPQAEGFTRITEYTKLPVQKVGERTCYAVEYPVPYRKGQKVEPYYPVLTEESKKLYKIYREEARKYTNLYLCGRLADFEYYNMDQALEKALDVCRELGLRYGKVE